MGIGGRPRRRGLARHPGRSPHPGRAPRPGASSKALAGPSAPAAEGSGPAAAARGRLFVVATPIGNLSDVTLRALEVLAAVPLVAAEDTRLTRRLFVRHSIATPLTSYHERDAAAREPELLAHLRAGRDLALVTDAGTPLVSDPGAGLVSAWADEGGEVVPIPGASAVLAAVVAAAVAGPRWSFEGFLPRSGRERRDRVARIAADPRASVLFEAPSRIAATLADLAIACGEDRPAAVCRELTKLHESVARGSVGALRDAAASGSIPARGEFVVVIGEWRRAAGPGAADADAPEPLDAARAEVERLVSTGLARGEAARAVAARTGIARRRLYGAPARRTDDGR